MKKINVCIALNHKYFRYAYVLLTSLFMNHASGELSIYVLNSDLRGEDEAEYRKLADRFGQEISFLSVKHIDLPKDLPTTEAWSMEMYYRLLVGELLPKELERVLYLDVDIIVHKPLADFYFMDMAGADIAAADDPMIQGNFSGEQEALFAGFAEGVRYFNSGVILYDLKKMRESYNIQIYLETAREFDYRLTNPDQDLLNYVHQGKVHFIDNTRYNVFAQIKEIEDHNDESWQKKAAIVHYAGRKPWNYNGTHYLGEKLWWQYAKETPYYYELMETVFLDGLMDESYPTIMALSQENAELKKNLNEALALCKKIAGMN